MQLLLFRHSEDRYFECYEDAIVRAFQGGKEAAGYLATGDDLGIDLRGFSGAVPPPGTAKSEFDAFRHTLIVVLIDQQPLSKGADTLWDWLAACADRVRDSDGRHAALFVSRDERSAEDFGAKRPALGALQRLIVTDDASSERPRKCGDLQFGS